MGQTCLLKSSHLEVPEVGKQGVLWQRAGHSELHLLGIDVESVANVDSHLGSDAADQPVDLALKVHLVVDDVNVRMAWTGKKLSRKA